MKCLRCKREIGKLKKYQLYKCTCKAKLMCLEINKNLILVDLSKDKGES